MHNGSTVLTKIYITASGGGPFNLVNELGKEARFLGMSVHSLAAGLTSALLAANIGGVITRKIAGVAESVVNGSRSHFGNHANTGTISVAAAGVTGFFLPGMPVRLNSIDYLQLEVVIPATNSVIIYYSLV